MQKRITLHFYLIFLCLSLPLAAQDMPDTIPWKNEISLTLFSVKESYGLYSPSSYYLSALNGIRYVRHIGPDAIRLGIDYKNSREEGWGNVIGTGAYQEGKFYLGYQIAFSASKVRPYFALDLMYLMSKLDSEYHVGCFGFYSKADVTVHGIGFAPALGIRYPLNKRFSIAWEGNLECLWSSEKGSQVIDYNDDMNTKDTYPVDQEGFIYFLNPVKSIALNFGF